MNRLRRLFSRSPARPAPRPASRPDIDALLNNAAFLVKGNEAVPMAIKRATNQFSNTYYSALNKVIQGAPALDDSTLANLYTVGVTAWTCVQVSASILSDIPLRVVNGEGQPYEVQTPLGYVLARQRQLLWLLDFSLNVWGKFYLLKQRNIHGYPTGLLWLNPLDVTPVLDYGTGEVKEYRVTDLSHRVSLYHPQDMVAYYNFNPTDPFNGLSPYELIYKRVVTEDWISEFVRSFFSNFARPDGMLTYSGSSLDVNSIDQVREDWQQYKGTGNAGKTFVAASPGGEWKWTPVTAPMPDLAMRDNRTALIDDTCAAFRVSSILVGLTRASDSLSAINTYREARATQVQAVHLPRARLICEVLQEQWADEFYGPDESYYITPDESQITLDTNATTERGSLASAVTGKIGSLDEGRALLGYGPAPKGTIQRDPAWVNAVWTAGNITYGEYRLNLGLDLDKTEWESLRIWDIDPRLPKPAAQTSIAPVAAPTTLAAPEPEGSILLSLSHNPAVARQVALLQARVAGEWLLPEEWHVTVAMCSPALTQPEWLLEEFAESLAGLVLWPRGLGTFATADGHTLHLTFEPEPLMAFQQRIVKWCQAQGFTLTEHSLAYKPHLTLAYLPAPPPARLPFALAQTSLWPRALTVGRKVAGEWQDIAEAPLTLTRTALDDVKRWRGKIKKSKRATVPFHPDALPGDISQWIKLQLREGWNEQVVFEAARAWIDTGEPPLPLGASPEDYLRYWTTFDTMQSTLGDDFLQYMGGFSEQALWNALEILHTGNLTAAQAFEIPINKSDEQALLNAWVGTPSQPGALTNFILAGDAGAAALTKSTRNSSQPLLDAPAALTSTEAVQKARQYGMQLVSNLNDTTREAMRDLLVQAIEEGWDQATLADNLATILWLSDNVSDNLAHRAAVIAQNESVKAYNLGAFDRWQAEGVEQAVWQSLRDSHVCFQAFAPISTEDGLRAIQTIRPGDKVWTRDGLKRVSKTSRIRYEGDMVRLVTRNGTITTTGNHPIFTLEQGWLAARNIGVGHTLQTPLNEPLQVLHTSNFFLSQTNHMPTRIKQFLRFPQITRLIAMPIRAINFNDRFKAMQRKINSVLFNDFGLLLKRYAQIGQSHANSLFNRSFSPIPLLTTSQGTSETFITFITNKLLSTDNTFQSRISIGSATIIRTNSKSVGNRGSDGKFAATHSTDFSSVLGDSSGLVTIIATIFLASIYAGLVAIKDSTASLANHLSSRFGGSVIALSTTEMAGRFKHSMRLNHKWLAAMEALCFNHRFVSFIQSSLLLYHKWRGFAWVYNLEVEDVHEYYAFGVLVHNCLLADTPVSTPEGLVSIQDLQPGGKVVTRGGLATIDQVHIVECTDPYLIHFSSRTHELTCTPDHLIFTRGGEWVEAQFLSYGKSILLQDGSYEVLRQVRFVPLEAPLTVYNLTLVGEAQEYFAAGLLVHNCEICKSLHGVVGDLSVGWVSPLSGDTYYEQAHIGCRCFRRPYFGETMLTRHVALPRRRIYLT